MPYCQNCGNEIQNKGKCVNCQTNKDKIGCLPVGCLIIFFIFIFMSIIGNSSNNYSTNTTNEVVNEPVEINILTKQEKLNSKQALKKMRVKHDQVENNYWYYDKNSPLYDNSNGIYLYFGKQKNNIPYTLRFKLSFTNNDWIFFKTLIFNIDGENYSIIPKSSEINHDNYEYIWETVDMPLSDDNGSRVIIEKIIKSKKTIVRFEGDKYYLDKTITKSQKNAMKRVIQAYTALGGSL